MLALRFLGRGRLARMSEMAMRPPGFSRRCISLKTRGLSSSGTRLITQLEMMQSAVPGGMADMSVIWASTKLTLVLLCLALISLARASMSWSLGSAGTDHNNGGVVSRGLPCSCRLRSPFHSGRLCWRRGRRRSRHHCLSQLPSLPTRGVPCQLCR